MNAGGRSSAPASLIHIAMAAQEGGNPVGTRMDTGSPQSLQPVSPEISTDGRDKFGARDDRVSALQRRQRGALHRRTSGSTAIGRHV